MRVTVKVRVTDNDGATAVATARSPSTPRPHAAGRRRRHGGGSDGGGGGGSDGSGDGGGSGGPGGSSGTAFTASLGGASIQALKRVVRRGVGVSCQVDRSATCVLELVVSGRDARRLRLAKGKRARKPVRIARGRATTAASGSKAVTLKLIPAGAPRAEALAQADRGHRPGHRDRRHRRDGDAQARRHAPLSVSPADR